MKSKVILGVICLQPLLASADVGIDGEIKGLIKRFVDAIVDPLFLAVFALAFLLFMWGLLQFMVAVSQGEASDSGKRHMLWGVLGLVIMFSVAGIINVITNSIGETGSDPVEIKGGFE